MTIAAVRVSRALTPARSAPVFGAILAWAGWGFVDSGYVDLVWQFWGDVRPDGRQIPADKFFDPNTNPIGLSLAALGVMAIVEILNTPGRVWIRYATLFAAALGCAFLYPLSYLGLVAALAGSTTVILAMRREWFDRRLFTIAIIVGVAGLIASPYWLSIGSGKHLRAQLTVSNVDGVTRKVRALLTGSVMVIPVIVLLRDQMLEFFNKKSCIVWCLAGATIALCCTYVFIQVPYGCSYKFLGASALPVACILASCMSAVVGKRPLLVSLLLSALLLSATERTISRAQWPFEIPVQLSGVTGRARDAEQDKTLQFLRSRTPVDAVIVANDVLVATVGNRSMFSPPVALGPMKGDGWSAEPSRYALALVGHKGQLFLRRMDLARKMLDGALGTELVDCVRAVEAMVPGRAVYVVCTPARSFEYVRAGFSVVHPTGQYCVVRITDK